MDRIENYTTIKWLGDLFGKHSFVNQLNKVGQFSQQDLNVDPLDEIETRLKRSVATYGNQPFISQEQLSSSVKSRVSTSKSPLFFKEKSAPSTNRLHPIANKIPGGSSK